jgi:hypothetical protein
MLFWGDTIQSPHYYKNIWCIENENGWALVFMRVYTTIPLCHSFPVSYRICVSNDVGVFINVLHNI